MIALTMGFPALPRPFPKPVLWVTKDRSSPAILLIDDARRENFYRGNDRWGFPEELVRRLDFWCAWFEAYEPGRLPEDSEDALWKAYGLGLAIDIKRHVRDAYTVFYPRMGDEIPLIPYTPESVYGSNSP